jgi:hypothetical protein
MPYSSLSSAIFRAKTAISHNNIVGNMVTTLAAAESGRPRNFVMRFVGNGPTVSPAARIGLAVCSCVHRHIEKTKHRIGV